MICHSRLGANIFLENTELTTSNTKCHMKTLSDPNPLDYHPKSLQVSDQPLEEMFSKSSEISAFHGDIVYLFSGYKRSLIILMHE